MNIKKINISSCHWHQLATLVVVFLFALPYQAFSSHIVGGEIGYRCLGNNQYEITVDVYRDCFYGAENAQFDDPASVGIFKLDNNLLHRELKIDFVVDDTLSNDLTDPCLFVPDDVCVHTTTYKDTITLLPQDSPAGYKLVYQRCCRNETISNIEDPFNTGATYTIDLTPDAMSSCNTSPRFNFPPPVYICIGKPIRFDHAAIDSDGDSLAYKFCIPKSGASFNNPQPQPPRNPPYDNVILREGITLNNLLGGQDPATNLTIDPNTGLITGQPTSTGQYVVGVCVEEYRNGQLLSITRRDFEYNVGLCGEVAAIIGAPAAQCDDLTVQFESLSTEADNFIWFFDENNPRATSTEKNPTYTYPDTGLYTVRLVVEPGTGCENDTTVQVFLQTNSIFVDFDIEDANCGQTSVIGLANLSTDNISGIDTYLWEIIVGRDTIISTEQNPLIEVPIGSTGIVTLTATSVNGCTNTVTKTFQTGEEDPGQEVQEQLSVCFGDSISLNPNAPQITTYHYNWTPTAFLDDPTSPNPTAYVEETTTFTVIVSPANDLCTFEKTVTVTVLDRPQLSFETETSCNGLTVVFNNTSQNTNGYFWDFGDIGTHADTSDQRNPFYAYPDTGNYVVTLIGTNEGMCADTLEKTIDLGEKNLTAAIDVVYTSCSEDTIVANFIDVSVNDLDNTISREWTFESGENSTEESPSFTYTEDQRVIVSLSITTAEGCTSITTDTFDINLINNISLVDSMQICSGNAIELNPNADSTYQYNWMPANNLDNANSPNPTASPTETTTYTVIISTTEPGICEIQKEVTIVVAPSPNLTVNDDISTCDATTTIFASSDEEVTYEYINEMGEIIGVDSTTTLTVPVSGVSTYIVRASTGEGCVSERSITISGGPVDIEINANNGAVAACQGEVLQTNVTNLDSNDSLTYRWEPAEHIISGANTSNPVFAERIGEHLFFVTATSQFGCAKNDSVIVAVIDTTFQLGFESQLGCDGGTVDFINTSTNAFGYFWDFGDNRGTSTEESPTYSYLQAGTYEVYLTLQYDVSCTDTLRKTIEVLEPNIMVDYDFDYIDCNGSSTTIQFNSQASSNMTGDLTYQWTFSTGDTSTEENPSITLSESQLIKAELCVISSNGCQTCYSQDLDVQVIQTELADEREVSICSGESIALNPSNFDPNYTYQWSPATGLDDPTAANPIASPDVTTVYTLTIPNFSADTCEVRKQVTVVVSESLDASFDFDYINCNGTSTDIQFTSQVSENASYTWTLSNGDISNEANPTFSFLEDTVVKVELCVTASNGCQACTSQDLDIQVIQIDLEDESELSICAGESIALNPTNSNTDYTYQWSPATGLDDPTIANPTASPETTTTYTLTVPNISADTCNIVKQVTVSVTEDLDAGFTYDYTNCNGITTEVQFTSQVFVTGNLTYTWTLSDGRTSNEANPIFTFLEDALVTVELCIMADSGCQACTSQDLDIQVIKLEVGTQGDLNICAGEAVALNPNGNPDYTYQWSPATGLDDPTAVNPIASPTETTTYTVTVPNISADTCGATQQVTVVVEEAIEIEFTSDSDTDNETGTITTCGGVTEVTVNSSTNNVTYTWTNAEGTEISSEESIVINPDGTTIYFVTITNPSGCSTTDSVTVINNGIDIDISTDLADGGGSGNGGTDACQNTEFQLTATNNIPDQNITYNWTAGIGGTIVAGAMTAMPTVIANEVGTTTFYLNATNEFDCTYSDSITIMVTPFMPNFPTTATICANTPTELNPNGNMEYIYEWAPITGLNDPNSPNPIANITESITYTVTITNNTTANCQTVETLIVNVPPVIDLVTSKDTIFCETTTVTLTADTDINADYVWSTSPDFSSVLSTNETVDVTPEGNMTYYIQASDEFGCMETASLNINNASIRATLLPEFNFCVGTPTQLNVNNPSPDQELTYFWSPLDAITEGEETGNPTIDITEDTDFTVEIENQFGCMTTLSTTVIVTDLQSEIMVTASPDTIPEGASTQLNATKIDDYTYNWTPPDGLSQTNIHDPVATPAATTTYTLEVSANGCIENRDIIVTVLNSQCEFPFIFVPNAFTPNNDGENDEFLVYGSFVEEVEMIVFNRWGQKVFQSDRQDFGWDGKFNGKELEPDVFGYYLRVVCVGGQEFTQKGNVSLLK